MVEIKGLVKGIAKRCGYEILKYPHDPNAYATRLSLTGLIEQERINLVLDVGANTGQFVAGLRAAGYSGRVISFEPLTSAHSQLRNRAGRDPNWMIADRTAIGAEAGSVEIHISANTFSSSILDILPSHLEAEPESSYVGSELVPVNRLDDLCTLSPTDRVLLKIDVQGYEKQVLDGAQQVIGKCRAVVTEMSLRPLYDRQVLARDLWDLVEAQGFEVWSLEPGFRNPETGRTLQLDGVFVRSDEEPKLSSVTGEEIIQHV